MENTDDFQPEKDIPLGNSTDSEDLDSSLIEESVPSLYKSSALSDRRTSTTSLTSPDSTPQSAKPKPLASANGPSPVLRKRLSTNFSALPIGLGHHQNRGSISISGLGVGLQSNGAIESQFHNVGALKDGAGSSGGYGSLGSSGPTRARRSLSQPFRSVSGSKILPQPNSSASIADSGTNSPAISTFSASSTSTNSSETSSRTLSPVRPTVARSSSANVLSQNNNIMDCLSELAVKERRVFEIKERISRLNEELAGAEHELKLYRDEVSAVLSSHAMPPNSSSNNLNNLNSKNNNDEASSELYSIKPKLETSTTFKPSGSGETGPQITTSSLYSLYPTSPERKPPTKHSRSASAVNKFGFMTPMAVLDSLQSKLNAKDIKEALLHPGMNTVTNSSGASNTNSARHSSSLSNTSTISTSSADGTMFEDIDEEVNEEEYDEAQLTDDAGNTSLIHSDDIINMGKRVAGELGSQFWGFVEDIRNVTVGEDIRDNSSRYGQMVNDTNNHNGQANRAHKRVGSQEHKATPLVSLYPTTATTDTKKGMPEGSRRWKPKSQPQQQAPVPTMEQAHNQDDRSNGDHSNSTSHLPIINFDSLGI
ncbi:hypothetical protein NADFUDRAFT_47389 [Nadsonia fulvescens var. elongata DSM 6958]|uniref:DUF4048 domain-containing protein n=1 Tax=Nadsonia fulvescens var. elongata DSM 6958 TaxID=857566 RepID=A0A1E3PIQ3_9ASCO|nr:hypothetical protein NADFUDRAFT_47389 [Nadsonia fulvescens var. elongata DSM 6958]